MRQENSVLFALADLRSLEHERVAEEERAAERRRAVEAERRAEAEAERRRAEDERRLADDERRREQEERDLLARELARKSGQTEQLEADVRQLRALLGAVAAGAPPSDLGRRRVSATAIVAAFAVALVVAVVVASRRPGIRERVVYVPAAAAPSAGTTAALPTSLPARASAPPATVAAPPPRAAHASKIATPSKPKRTSAPATPLAVDDCGGKDPLCGTKL